jgi:hypothetical protein
MSLGYLALVNVLIAPFIVSATLYKHPYSISPSLDILGAASSPNVLRALGVLLVLLFAVVMEVLCLLDAGNERRWGWLVANLLTLVGLTVWMDAFSLLGVKSTLPEGALLLSFAFAATALIYTLWTASPRWRAQSKLAEPRAGS